MDKEPRKPLPDDDKLLEILAERDKDLADSVVKAAGEAAAEEPKKPSWVARVRRVIDGKEHVHEIEAVQSATRRKKSAKPTPTVLKGPHYTNRATRRKLAKSVRRLRKHT